MAKPGYEKQAPCTDFHSFIWWNSFQMDELETYESVLIVYEIQ